MMLIMKRLDETHVRTSMIGAITPRLHTRVDFMTQRYCPLWFFLPHTVSGFILPS